MTAPARPTTATLDAARAEARRLWTLAYRQMVSCPCVPTGPLCDDCVAVDRDAEAAGNRVEDLERAAGRDVVVTTPKQLTCCPADDHAGRAAT